MDIFQTDSRKTNAQARLLTVLVFSTHSQHVHALGDSSQPSRCWPDTFGGRRTRSPIEPSYSLTSTIDVVVPLSTGKRRQELNVFFNPGNHLLVGQPEVARLMLGLDRVGPRLFARHLLALGRPLYQAGDLVAQLADDRRPVGLALDDLRLGLGPTSAHGGQPIASLDEVHVVGVAVEEELVSTELSPAVDRHHARASLVFKRCIDR